jgi:arylformamidase
MTNESLLLTINRMISLNGVSATFGPIAAHKFLHLHYFYQYIHCDDMNTPELIDLTHTLESGMPVFPGSKRVDLITAATFDREGYHEITLNLSTHTGTHIDCAFHLEAGGTDTLTTPLDRFYGRACVIDCSQIPAGSSVSSDYLQTVELQIRSSEFVLLHTGWSRYWGSPEYFRKYPVLSEEAAAYLSAFPLKGVGSDTISFDPVDSDTLPVHHRLMSRHIILIENLNNLNQLPPGGFIFSCFPLRIREGDGSPVRAVGIVMHNP